MCRNDPTIKQIVKMLWNKDLAKLFIEFKKQLECVDETTEASLMFNRMHWALLSEAITNVTRRDNDGIVKYGLKNNMLMSSADVLEGVALTDTESTRAADELAHFKKVLKHHENIIFADGIRSGQRGALLALFNDMATSRSEEKFEEMVSSLEEMNIPSVSLYFGSLCTSEEVGCPSSVSGSIDSRCYNITVTKSMYEVVTMNIATQFA